MSTIYSAASPTNSSLSLNSISSRGSANHVGDGNVSHSNEPPPAPWNLTAAERFREKFRELNRYVSGDPKDLQAPWTKGEHLPKPDFGTYTLASSPEEKFVFECLVAKVTEEAGKAAKTGKSDALKDALEDMAQAYFCKVEFNESHPDFQPINDSETVNESAGLINGDTRNTDTGIHNAKTRKEDIQRSGQKQTLAVWSAFFPKLSETDQTALLKTFVDAHMQHLIFHTTTELDALQRGIEKLADWLHDMKEQGATGRVEVARALFAKIATFDSTEHVGRKRTLAWLLYAPSFMLCLYGIGIPLFRLCHKEVIKDGTSRGEGISLVQRELTHMRKLRLAGGLTDEVLDTVKQAYGAMETSFKSDNASRVASPGKDTRRSMFRVLLGPQNAFKYLDPNHFDEYCDKKRNGTILERVGLLTHR
jgi:hypothetical protein